MRDLLLPAGQPNIDAQSGIFPGIGSLSVCGWVLLAAVLVVGFLLAGMSACRGCRLPPADGLSVRV